MTPREAIEFCQSAGDRLAADVRAAQPVEGVALMILLHAAGRLIGATSTSSDHLESQLAAALGVLSCSASEVHRESTLQ